MSECVKQLRGHGLDPVLADRDGDEVAAGRVVGVGREPIFDVLGKSSYDGTRRCDEAVIAERGPGGFGELGGGVDVVGDDWHHIASCPDAQALARYPQKAFQVVPVLTQARI
ncbi:hypothetical protein ACVW00_003645 [Marmoricola sp. URHA0025 HA25]